MEIGVGQVRFSRQYRRASRLRAIADFRQSAREAAHSSAQFQQAQVNEIEMAARSLRLQVH
jgi:hypothetical protein